LPRIKEKMMEQVSFAFPVLPGQTAGTRAFFQEIETRRREEFAASEQRLGITKESWHLQQTPRGDLLLGYIESEDFAQALARFSQSRDSFDQWFKERLSELTGVDLNNPPPGPLSEQLADYRAHESAGQSEALATKFVHFLETGDVPEGLFTDDVFCDFTVPHWRLQAQGMEEIVALRKHGHPGPGKVPRRRYDPTATGFVLEFEESWTDHNNDWYSREMARADVRGGSIAALSVYCTGDWDTAQRAEHSKAVQLLRP
jgi:hypothetical protein